MYVLFAIEEFDKHIAVLQNSAHQALDSEHLQSRRLIDLLFKPQAYLCTCFCLRWNMTSYLQHLRVEATMTILQLSELTWASTNLHHVIAKVKTQYNICMPVSVYAYM